MQILALAARGTLEMVADECRALGLPIIRVSPDGVLCDANGEQIAQALVHLRIATRLLMHLADFDASDAETLYDHAYRIDWLEFLTADSTFAVFASGDVVPSTPTQRGLDNQLFVALKIKDAIADKLARTLGRRPNIDREHPQVSVVVRGRKGHWGVYLDLADPPLFQRGFRVAAGPAPLKETLAAALAQVAQWDGKRPLLDPMCGSGTLIIEAVNRAIGVAPGCTRTFAVESWPQQGPRMAQHLDAVREDAVTKAKKALHQAEFLDVSASDNDPSAIAAIKQNLVSAGLERVVRVEQADATKLAPPPKGTVILTNPPYGERLGGSDVTAVYRAMGQQWRTYAGCTAWIVDGHPDFRQSFGLISRNYTRLSNGRLEIALQRYDL